MWIVERVVVVVVIEESAIGHNVMDARSLDVPNAVFCIVVDEHRDFRETELVREVAVIVRVAVGVHSCHDSRNHVGVFGRRDRSEENVRAIPGREEHLFLSLKSEVEQMTLAEV